ncbi:MAG: hypothetical protein WD512_07540 [Candidatus Paceibacterota bacterium]
MEILTYDLRINTEEKYYEEVSSIVQLQPKNYKFGWSHEIVFEEQTEHYDIIAKFLDSLEGKYDKLQKLGISSNDISIWLIYGYINQCNMEFNPNTLERMGKNGITLCISCYESDG